MAEQRRKASIVIPSGLDGPAGNCSGNARLRFSRREPNLRQLVAAALLQRHPGRCHGRGALRRHRLRPCHRPEARAHDGRRRDGGERAG